MTAILSFEAPPPALAPADDHHRPLSAHVYRRRRLVVAAVLAGLLLGSLSLGRHAGAARVDTPDGIDTVTYLVQPGDTLWGIAGALAPDADPRRVVRALDDVAGGPGLQPGQRLLIPRHVLG